MAASLRRTVGLGYTSGGGNGYNGHGGGGGGSKYVSSSGSSHVSSFGQVEGLGLAGGSSNPSRDTLFGLPCTRSFSATLLPIYLLLLVWQSGHYHLVATNAQGGYDQPTKRLLTILLWILLVCFSRM